MGLCQCKTTIVQLLPSNIKPAGDWFHAHPVCLLCRTMQHDSDLRPVRLMQQRPLLSGELKSKRELAYSLQTLRIPN